MKRAFLTLVAFLLFATSLFGQIQTEAVNGWKIVAYDSSTTSAYSAIVDTGSGYSIYPYPQSTKSQKFYISGKAGSWVEWEKEYEEEYTMLPLFVFHSFTPAINGNGFGRLRISPTFGKGDVFFPSFSVYVNLWDHFWGAWFAPVDSQYHSRKFDKIRIRFTLQNKTWGVLYIDNIAVSNTGPELEPLIDKMGEDSIVSVEDESSLPSEFRLLQNYPNPFNPTTSIRYSVLNSTYVNLTVYDILGREVAMLVNEEKYPGTYTVTLDASGLSSGIYFYRLTAGQYTETKKMILQK